MFGKFLFSLMCSSTISSPKASTQALPKLDNNHDDDDDDDDSCSSLSSNNNSNDNNLVESRHHKLPKDRPRSDFENILVNYYPLFYRYQILILKILMMMMMMTIDY